MSREIKFRAWDKENEEYMNGYDVLLKYDGSAISRYALVTFDTDMPVNVIIEQFTGLVDRNGKEIYEGDILRVCHNRYDKPNKKGDRQLVEETFNCIVVRDTYKFGFKHQFAERASHIYYWDDFETHRFHDVTKIEIVGNIHENPELLEDK